MDSRRQISIPTHRGLINANNIDYAAIFYALNRSSFSGSTTAGGYSKQAAEKRFTESSIKRIKDFKAKNISVKAADFKVSIAAHPDAFLYLDPGV